MFSALTRVINARYLVNICHKIRIGWNSLLMISGFLIISLACFFDYKIFAFYLALLSSVLLGTASALGESTVLGFCSELTDKKLVGFFGSGTGFAGIFGSGFIILMKLIGLTNT